MQRIAIIGPSGSGKSTLARAMGRRLGITVVHLDAMFWHSGWVGTPRDEWRAIQTRLVQPPQWIIDGNYGSTLEIRLERADTVVFLDFSRRYTIPRVLRRRIQYQGRTRPDLAPGCPEKIDWEFIRWVWHFPQRERPSILQHRDARPAGQTWICLSNPREVQEFLDTISLA